MKQSVLTVLALILCGTLLTSCSSERTVYEEYIKFESLSWDRFNLLTFETEIENIETPYDFFVSIRHFPGFPHKEMLVNLTIYSPAGDMRSTDYTLELKDSEGQSLSSCMGDYCDVVIPLRRDFSFYEPGLVKFELENKYSKVELPGIIEIGFIVKESKQDNKKD